MCKSVQQFNSKFDILLRMKKEKKNKNKCLFWTYKKGFYKTIFIEKNKTKIIADSFPISLCFPQSWQEKRTHRVQYLWNRCDRLCLQNKSNSRSSKNHYCLVEVVKILSAPPTSPLVSSCLVSFYCCYKKQ